MGRSRLLRVPWFAVSLFFLVTFAMTWVTWVVSARLAGPANEGFFGVRGPVFLLGVFAPAIVAVALTAMSTGWRGVSALVGRIGIWEVDRRWYFIALGYMAAVKLAAALIHRITIGAWPPFGDTPLLLMFGAILISTWVQAGEEVGWRGYALPRLAVGLGLGPASIVLGGIWAVWHLPLFLMANTGSDGHSFPLYLLFVVALSVAMAWVYWKTGGSLLLVMLMHASVNNTMEIVPAAQPGDAALFGFEGSVVAWATVGLTWLIATPLLFLMRGANINALIEPDPRSTST